MCISNLVDAVDGNDDLVCRWVARPRPRNVAHHSDVLRVQVKPEHVVENIIDELVVLLAAENIVERHLIGTLLVVVPAPELELEDARVEYCNRDGGNKGASGVAQFIQIVRGDHRGEQIFIATRVCDGGGFVNFGDIEIEKDTGSIILVVVEEMVRVAGAQYDPRVGDDVGGGGYEHAVPVHDGFAVGVLLEERSHAVAVGEDAGAEGEVVVLDDVSDVDVSGYTDEFVDEIFGREAFCDSEAIGWGVGWLGG